MNMNMQIDDEHRMARRDVRRSDIQCSASILAFEHASRTASLSAHRRIKLFLCDVDGVLTDGSIFIGGEREFKRFNIRDGLGLVLARRAGLKVGWVSARPSPATKLRARGIEN